MNKNDDQENIKLCPGCFTGNRECSDFCVKCGRPIGNFTNYDPIKRIWSQGYAYRTSISEPSSPVVFFGVWILFGVPLVGMIAFLPQAPLVAVPFIAACAFVLYKTTKNYRKIKNSQKNSKDVSNKSLK